MNNSANVPLLSQSDAFDLMSLIDAGLRINTRTLATRKTLAAIEAISVGLAITKSAAAEEADRARIVELEAMVLGLNKDLERMTHKVITCGVAASHSDSELSKRPKDYGGKWDSPQAQKVRELRIERDRLKALYEELLFAVEHKFPNEDRHNTALRYIRQRERNSTGNIVGQNTALSGGSENG